MRYDVMVYNTVNEEYDYVSTHDTKEEANLVSHRMYQDTEAFCMQRIVEDN